MTNLSGSHRCCSLVLLLLVLVIPQVASSSTQYGSPSQHFNMKNDLGEYSRNILRRSPLHAFKQQFFLRELGSHKKKMTNKNISIGTRFSLHHPDRVKVAAWFGGGSVSGIAHEDAATTVRNRVQLASNNCNHDLAGVTNPTLQIDSVQAAVPVSVSSGSSLIRVTRRQDEEAIRNKASSRTALSSLVVASARKSIPWWPGIACQPDKSWRVLCFRQTVGVGLGCYQACRDAALLWEFDGASKGMVLVTEPSLINSDQRDDTLRSHIVRRRSWSDSNRDNDSWVLPCSAHQSKPVQQIWWGPGRRLVTYTSMGIRWLPKLYTVSPVTVIYDLVDQRGQATTYTSTAYATGKRHWLCGEERVTVCYRDSNHAVDVEILSYSKPSDSLTGRLVWPLIGGMQRAFFQQQMKSLERVAEESSNWDSGQTIDRDLIRP